MNGKKLTVIVVFIFLSSEMASNSRFTNDRGVTNLILPFSVLEVNLITTCTYFIRIQSKDKGKLILICIYRIRHV